MTEFIQSIAGKEVYVIAEDHGVDCSRLVEQLRFNHILDNRFVVEELINHRQRQYRQFELVIRQPGIADIHPIGDITLDWVSSFTIDPDFPEEPNQDTMWSELEKAAAFVDKEYLMHFKDRLPFTATELVTDRIQVNKIGLYHGEEDDSLKFADVDADVYLNPVEVEGLLKKRRYASESVYWRTEVAPSLKKLMQGESRDDYDAMKALFTFELRLRQLLREKEYDNGAVPRAISASCALQEMIEGCHEHVGAEERKTDVTKLLDPFPLLQGYNRRGIISSTNPMYRILFDKDAKARLVNCITNGYKIKIPDVPLILTYQKR